MQTMKRGLMGEINVVPYIDVMLVLLVIFMVTAPLLTQGVNVALPQADANAMADQQEPIIASIDASGQYYLNIGADPKAALDSQRFQAIVAAALRAKPGKAVMVKGDKNVAYGDVVRAMALLQQAGAPNVGLITDPASYADRQAQNQP